MTDATSADAAFTVREATADDARAVHEVHVAAIEGLGPQAYDDEQVAAWGAGGGPDSYDFGAEASRFVVAEVESGVAGADDDSGAGEADDDSGVAGADDDSGVAWADDESAVAWADDESAVAGADDESAVAWADGHVVGFGEVVLEPPDYLVEPADGEVRAVYVHPSAVRQGVGSALLADLERRAREAGVGSLGLHASLNAVPFYEAHGYDRVAERTHEFSGGVEGTVVEMRRDLFGARA